jgi:hypothetical protein
MQFVRGRLLLRPASRANGSISVMGAPVNHCTLFAPHAALT